MEEASGKETGWFGAERGHRERHWKAGRHPMQGQVAGRGPTEEGEQAGRDQATECSREGLPSPREEVRAERLGTTWRSIDEETSAGVGKVCGR